MSARYGVSHMLGGRSKCSREKGSLSVIFIHSGNIHNPFSMASPFVDTGDPK